MERREELQQYPTDVAVNVKGIVSHALMEN